MLGYNYDINLTAKIIQIVFPLKLFCIIRMFFDC